MAIHPMLNQPNQLFVITGARNTGKSLMASTFLPPDMTNQVFYVDSENSANAIVAGMAEQGIGFGHYLSLGDRFENLPDENDLLSRISDGKLPWVDSQGRSGLIEMYEFLVETIDKELKPGKYNTFVFDTIEKLEASMAAWVDANKKKSGVTNVAYGKLWTDGVFPLYENLLSSIYGRGVKTIIFTSHLKTPWEGNRPVVGKVIPSGKKILYFLSKFMVWLVKESNNADGAPAGIILKERMPSMTVVDGRWVVKRQLPRRLPRATWQAIEYYLDNGCDLVNPQQGEALSAEEAEMVSDMITDKQMELMLLDARKQLLDAQTADNTPMFATSGEPVEIAPIDMMTKTIRDLSDQIKAEGIDATPSEVKKRVEAMLGGAEVSIAQIIKALK